MYNIWMRIIFLTPAFHFLGRRGQQWSSQAYGGPAEESEKAGKHTAQVQRSDAYTQGAERPAEQWEWNSARAAAGETAGAGEDEGEWWCLWLSTMSTRPIFSPKHVKYSNIISVRLIFKLYIALHCTHYYIVRGVFSKLYPITKYPKSIPWRQPLTRNWCGGKL